MGSSRDTRSQKSTHDVETPIILPSKEIQSNDIRKEDNGHYLLGGVKMFPLWISLAVLTL
jgi:hypothetical protein